VNTYLLERAWLGDRMEDDVLVQVAGGRFTVVEPGGRHPDAVRWRGLSIPGLANGHSHAFHRALRGHVQRDRGTFWTWRERMYAVAERLTPENYYALARATYAEMLAAGYTSVGEFHYVHHRPDGTPYPAGEMEHAVQQAAEDAGIRLALLDTCYLSSGFGAPPDGVQLRYSDGTAAAWAERAGTGPAAIHSVRAVPREELATFRGRAPLHVHLSEQPAENEACLAAYGLTPTGLLHAEGLLGPGTTVVHATHLTDDDIALLGGTGTQVCATPTTERDLADGIGPIRRLAEAGCRVGIGSDSHAVLDPFEELRGLEMHERLATGRRGHWSAAELLAIGTAHDLIGIDDCGRIAVGQRADLVNIALDSPRTAGTGAGAETAVFAATAADVVQVLAGGRIIDLDRAAVAADLETAIGALL